MRIRMRVSAGFHLVPACLASAPTSARTRSRPMIGEYVSAQARSRGLAVCAQGGLGGCMCEGCVVLRHLPLDGGEGWYDASSGLDHRRQQCSIEPYCPEEVEIELIHCSSVIFTNPPDGVDAPPTTCTSMSTPPASAMPPTEARSCPHPDLPSPPAVIRQQRHGAGTPRSCPAQRRGRPARRAQNPS